MADKKMSQANFTATKDLRVCYQHFERHCYKRDLKSEMLRISAKKIFEAYNPRLSPENAVNKRKTSFYHTNIDFPIKSYAPTYSNFKIFIEKPQGPPWLLRASFLSIA